MQRARAKLRYGPRPTAADYLSPRATALEQALVAAGAPGLLPTYDMLYGGHAHRLFQSAVMEAGLTALDSASWPHEGEFVSGVAGEVFRENDTAFYRLEGGAFAFLHVGHGWASATIAASSSGATTQALAMFQALYPATYLDATDARVPVTFWMLGKYGPERRLRMIDASPWDDIRRNYTASVAGELDGVMGSFEPGKGGLLMLWQGPPGTGKTWALRALVSEWLPWAEFHYITDPDAFFVENAGYMVEVLLSDSYEAIDAPTGDVVSEADPEGKWRVLILEDTGELLSANAKEKYGQGLSRLLNVVDGLIGQGLRVLVLVTTNDELGELNQAVRRPGRCASQIVFAPLTDEEAAEWLGAEVEDGTTTLADLYARADAGEEPLAEPEDLTASATPDVVAEIQAVAREHAPEGGYGETSWNEATQTVFWNHADWTSNEEHDAAEQAFLAIDGVESFECESEANAPVGDGWEQVWPEPASEEAYERILALANLPLDVRPAEQTQPRTVTAAAAPAPMEAEGELRLVERAFDAFEGILRLARPKREEPKPAVDPIAERALEALSALAGRPETPPTFHVHVQPPPAPDVSVTTPATRVEVPVTVEAAPTPDVHVHVPKQEAAQAPPAPDVHVHVPAQEPPKVEVTNQVPAAAAPKVEVTVERPRPTAIRVERDPDGTKVYVPEEEE